LFLAPGREPDEVVNFLGYCLAYTANKYGLQIHAGVTMSNHYHVDLTDPHGELVAWKQLFNSMLARGLNARRGRFDSFWSGDGPCDTRRPSDDETFMDLVYTITNPVKSGLVKWSRLWPGFTTAGWRFGETRTFARPKWFFDASGEMPEEASLTLVRPPIFRELDDDALYDKLAAAVRDKEHDFQAGLRAKGRRFMGLRKLGKQHWNRAAASFEERFGLTPKVAASSKWQRLAQLQRDREWEREYAVARAQWRAGEAAVFPAGTYWLRRFAGVAVAEQPP
jgi:REP element-mobilizing transposase RayT